MTSRPTLDEVYLTMLKEFARRSTCVRRQVACIFTDYRGVVLSCGYNGVPRDIAHCTEIPCEGAHGRSGDTRNCYAVHAEQNAILNCKDLNYVATVYCSCTPCFECAKMLSNLPSIRCVKVQEPYADVRGARLFKQRGIELIILEPSKPIHDTSFESEDRNCR